MTKQELKNKLSENTKYNKYNKMNKMNKLKDESYSSNYKYSNRVGYPLKKI